MRGKTSFQQLIEPNEAIRLFRHSGVQEMHIAKDLSSTYWVQAERGGDIIWDVLSLLSFIYDTG